ncbi:hypothetical protein JRO89_XS14G0081100 [Xanthoceras sorbifolium]|uniref:ARM repeat superfamily protein n=1 Tax=Xanthoceras sorbifolium TaxID=99658 RepID=A0ABQ8H4F9_9ROSI|nr:hypothetical protein JRO89_XS14G0081100 [Xanthoceras sorbifolium]
MSDSLSALHRRLIQLTKSILESLNETNYKPLESGGGATTKSIVYSLLDTATKTTSEEIRNVFRDSTLVLALLISSRTSTHDSLSWIPERVSVAAESAFRAFADEYVAVCKEDLVVVLLPETVPNLKEKIKESSIDKENESDEFSAASARTPVVHAILAAYQFRWFVTQFESPRLGELCNLVIPCALTALDHWSPEVKGQGMLAFTHIAKNVNPAEIGWYGDVILDACCQNIASADEIWELVVEMSVLLVTCTQRSNCRSSWFERILNEMLSHLERQPRNKDRRIAWLKFIEPLFNAVGLVLLAHFRRIFPLFFQWMHADDDETVLLVLKRLQVVIKLTWIRNTPYIGRLVDELTKLYKEAALRRGREEIRANILQILVLLQQCKGMQFEAAWDKYKDDPNLSCLGPSLSGRIVVLV